MGGNTGDKPVNHLKHLASGGITGAIEACITYPTEFVKTKMQLYPKYAKMGVIGAFKDTVKLDGVKGLYRGLSVLVTLSAPKTGIRFYSKSFYDSQLQVSISLCEKRNFNMRIFIVILVQIAYELK